MRTSAASLSGLLLLVLSFLLIAASPVLSSSERASLQVIDLENPVLQFGVSPCQRVQVTGESRWNFKLYASAVRATLNFSEVKPDRVIGKLKVCFHRNSSVALCQCEKEQWEYLQKSHWVSVISPYEKRFIDINVDNSIRSSLTVTLEEDFQQWRLVCLGIGFLLLLTAPIVSSWVPFYYSSSMALGVLLVVLIILFQGMKLLPTGRKNTLYLALYGSVLGVGSFIAHYLSTLINSLLVSFGLNEELHNPVSVFLLVGIVLAGAALGYWIVRKFIISEDGSVDAGVAQFVKWAMRFIGVVFLLQSTLDVPLALASVATIWSFCSLVNSRKWGPASTKNGDPWKQIARQASSNRQAEFLSPTSKKMGMTLWRSPSPYPSYVSPTQGRGYSSPPFNGAVEQDKDYYSTYHKMPTRKYSKKEWEVFTHESTSSALREWASTPDVARWIAENAHRMRVDHSSSSDNTTGSSSGSSEETVEDSSAGRGFFNWL